MALAAALSLVKGLAFARLLGPNDFSYYASLDLVVAYGMYAGTLGLLEGLNRELPLALGRGRARAARVLAARAGGAILALSLSALLAFASLVWLLTSDGRLRLALIQGGAVSVVNNFFLLTTLLLAVRRRHVVFAGALAGKSALALLLGSAASLYFGLAGALAAELVAVGAAALWIVLREGVLPDVRFGRLGLLRSSFETGLPVLLANLAANLSRNLDRLFVAASLGVAVFGQYSFALLLVLGWAVALNALTQYLTPRICGDYAAGTPLAALRRRLDRIVLSLALAGGLAYLPLMALVEGIAPRWVPGFEMGVSLMRPLYLGGLLQMLLLYQVLLLADGRAAEILRQALATALLSAALCLAGWWSGATAAFFAWAFVAHRAAAGLLALRAARRSGPAVFRPPA